MGWIRSGRLPPPTRRRRSRSSSSSRRRRRSSRRPPGLRQPGWVRRRRAARQWARRRRRHCRPLNRTPPLRTNFVAPTRTTLSLCRRARSVDPVREFLGGQYFDKPKLATLHPDLGGLRALAQAGQFEQLVALSEVVMQGLARLPPHERLAVRHARLVAFLRLRKHDFANAELEEVGELDRPQYCYETYATAYPDGRKGSFVPFSLRVLKAEMPGRLSSERTAVDDTVDALLALRGWCRSQSGSDDTEPWRSRDDFITERLVAHATAAQEVEKALSLMKEQAERRPVEQQSSWLTKLGRVYLQYGQLAAAEDAFSRAEAYSSGGDDEDIVHELNGTWPATHVRGLEQRLLGLLRTAQPPRPLFTKMCTWLALVACVPD